ncbi:hypothetical protein GH714_013243 [Hevea brasiliensis]|uniref:Retrotransposon gag domain-containing protein n=1 Tax=Hevea brasiliensis TaxID=3981 RepID=A0A6A6MC73_HEVBR|nr:hypothetical protein GH714_013243 [Hevea brasiliensis]
MSNEGEVPPPVLRGLTLDQAHILRLERQQNAMQEQIVQITQALARLVTLQPQRERNGPRQQEHSDNDDEEHGVEEEYSKAKKCKLTAIEFVDYANLWWENVKAQRCGDGLDDIQTWREMKRIMEK